MGKLIAIVGPSGVGKTSLAHALAAAGDYMVGYEGHADRPFQALLKQDSRYALANQLDYLIQRADEERRLRLDPRPALVDGGLDLDFHGFTRLFHARGWLSDDEFALCRRFHDLTRTLLPPPDLIVRLSASPHVISRRLAARNRINLASGEDADRLDRFIDDWLESVPSDRKLNIDVSGEDLSYAHSAAIVRASL
jgi:deoxyadenosine/deoxycytidine kinase